MLHSSFQWRTFPYFSVHVPAGCWPPHANLILWPRASAAGSQAGLTSNFSCQFLTGFQAELVMHNWPLTWPWHGSCRKQGFHQFLHCCVRTLLSDGFGIVACLHSCYLAMAVSLAPQFLLWANMPQYFQLIFSIYTVENSNLGNQSYHQLAVSMLDDGVRDVLPITLKFSIFIYSTWICINILLSSWSTFLFSFLNNIFLMFWIPNCSTHITICGRHTTMNLN
jgi:hypothetical protein